MLAEERFSQILALLAEKRTATVQELCEALNVSESTIRRDLLELDRQGRFTAVPRCQAASSEPTSPRWKPRKHWPSAKKTPSPKPPPLLSRPMISSTWTPGPPRWPWHGPSAARRWTPTTSPTASPTRGCWRKKAAASLCLAACCAPRPRPSSARQPWRRCSSTTSPRRFWGPTALIWSPGSPPRTLRKPPSRPVPPAAPTRYGFWPMTPSSAASTRP